MRGKKLCQVGSNVTCRSIDKNPFKLVCGLLLFDDLRQVAGWWEQNRASTNDFVEKVAQQWVDEWPRYVLVDKLDRADNAKHQHEECKEWTDFAPIQFNGSSQTESGSTIENFEEAPRE